MAWRRSGDKPLSEPMVVRLPTHKCVTRPQWVKDVKMTRITSWDAYDHITRIFMAPSACITKELFMDIHTQALTTSSNIFLPDGQPSVNVSSSSHTPRLKISRKNGNFQEEWSSGNTRLKILQALCNFLLPREIGSMKSKDLINTDIYTHMDQHFVCRYSGTAVRSYMPGCFLWYHIYGSMQDCSISIATTLETLLPCIHHLSHLHAIVRVRNFTRPIVLRWVKVTVGQVEYLQDLSDGRFSHLWHWLYIFQTSEWYIQTSDFHNPLAWRTSAFNLKFRSLIVQCNSSPVSFSPQYQYSQ